MKFIKYIFFILFTFCSLVPLSIVAQETSSYFLHTVEKGQSLYYISTMYNVPQADIIRLNPGSETKLYAGQSLKIPQKSAAQVIFHTIQPGENLYRLSTKYNVSTKNICDDNPGLSAENFKAGQVIRIVLPVTPVEKSEVQRKEESIQPEVKPRCREMHKVKRKETLYSVSRDYGISQEELKEANPELNKGMKKGQLLCIPYPAEKVYTSKVKPVDVITMPPSNRDLVRDNQEETKNISVIKVAVILPFLSQEGKRSESARMVEYYEGFLMAVDSLKRQGVSMDIYAYDSGSEHTPIASLLKKEELKKMDIIFGPLYAQHIAPLAAFADEHSIRLVIPIIKDDAVFNNPRIYQVNTPQSYLYSEVYEHFTRQFSNANVIIMDMKTDENDKNDFIKGLQQELNRKGVANQIVNGSELSQQTLKLALRTDKENIFIPNSGSAITVNKIIPALKILAKSNTDSQITMFGYPEWQTYTAEHLQNYFELNTYFFSSYYTNNIFSGSKSFTQQYRKWYAKDMIDTYPKYGMLGFDTGFYFLSALNKYGTGIEYNLDRMKINPVQTGFKFERVNNWGGFINKKVFFIHYTRDYELVKIDFE